MALTLFVADDEPAFRRLVSRVAMEHGWAVVECADGEALVSALAAGHGPGLILVDMMMPGMDGMEAILRLHEMSVGLPICFITGGPAIHTMAARLIGEARELNVIDTLTKPLGFDDLTQLLDRVSAIADSGYA